MRETEQRQAKELEPKTPRAPNYTTKAAIAWGRRQGWKLLDRERYDYRLRRHHDLPLGADAMFESDEGVVYVQGAGRSERKAHRERFDRAGGKARAERLRCQFYYLEFVRSDPRPVHMEKWA